MIQQVHNSCQFHGLPGDDANKHLNEFLHVTQSIKVNGVTDDAIRLYLFHHSLTHHATAWFDHLPRNSINTFEQMAKMFLGKYFPPSMVMKLRNEITNFRQRLDESLFEAWKRYKLSIDRCPNHNMLPVTQIDTFYNGLTLRHCDTINVAADGTFMKRPLKAEMAKINKNFMRVLQPPLAKPRTYMLREPTKVVTTAEFTNYMKANNSIIKNMQTNMISLTNFNLELKNMFGQFMKMNTASSSGSRTLPSNTITNPKEDLKVERETEVTKDTVPPTNNGSTKDVQPLVDQIETLMPNSELVFAPINEPVVAPVSASKPNQKPSIPFADALILMPKFGPTIKTLLTNKDKVSELARTPLNEHCSAVKLPEQLGDPGKFLIPCDFMGMDECLALADPCASINLMPLLVWNKLSLPELSPTCMTLELVDRSISHPVRVAEDVFVKVGTFHFPADFVVVDFDADPRVPLIFMRSFLKTERALIDVFEGELTLHVGKEAITLNLDQTLRYSANYNDMTANQIDVIDMDCEEYSQEVLSFSDVIASGNPTIYYEPIVSTSYPTLTPFEDSDFFLEEVDAFLALEDGATSLEVDQSYYDLEGEILLLEAFLNDDPSLPPSTQGNYFPQVRKELKICEAKNDKSSIDEPPEVELKDLPPHLEYAFLEGDDKFPVIIAKDLSDEEKTALIPVLNPWVSIVHCVSKKGGFTVVENEENELIPTRLVTGWRVCINYRKLNETTLKNHFSLPFMDQMLERLAENEYYCFLDGSSGYFQIPVNLKDQEKTTFTCPYGMFSYRRMHFGLCNALGTFQRNSFETCLSHLEKMLKWCEDTNLCLNWEKSHIMVKEGIVLGYKISKNWIEVDKAKVEVIAKLPYPTTVKGIRSFLGHVSFYRRFIQDFLKIARPMTRPLEKDTSFFFSKECVEAFQTLKRKLTKASILIALDWDLPFELMCDASDFAINVVLGQRQEKHFRPIHYASKTMTEAESNYTTTEKEMLAVVYAFKKLLSYLIMNKSIVYTDHSALKYLFAKKDSNARLLRRVLLL
nr:DNA-directed DNA polymerase [Tanacetum cinerariifolium]